MFDGLGPPPFQGAGGLPLSSLIIRVENLDPFVLTEENLVDRLLPTFPFITQG